MSGSFFSTSWYRVAGLKPRLRSHAHIHRHQYRDQTWYILQDRSTERFHRFSPAAYLVIGLMDGQRSVQEIWETACTRLGDDAPTQDEVIQLLSQLHQADVLLCDVPPDAAELLTRHERQIRRQWQNRLFSLFSWRFSLFDPDRLLRFFLPVVRPLMGWTGALLWLAVVPPALVLAAVHWSDLASDVLDRVLAPQNLLPLWLVYPVVKALHEFGHAFVVKAYGGEVHDMGVMILVLTPMPYVDASAASAFREKWHRILVGAAGILVELFVAALALFVWLSVEPGTMRTLCYNAMIIAGVSTVLFNGNPLLRYDGYYVLADLLEIPNLRSRGNSYLGYLAERYLFGRRETEPPIATPGERIWFVVYGITSFLYRVFIVVAILLFVADRFFLLGMIFAAMAAITWAMVPIGKGVWFLFTHPRIRSVRTRAIAVTVVLVALVGAVIALVPVPYRSRAEGVVWIPDEAFVRAGVEGFVERVIARPGARVRRGDVLIVCGDPILAAQVRELEARLRELEARYTEQHFKDQVRAEIIQEEIAHVREDLARARERSADLTIRSRADGTFVLPNAEDLPGRFVRQGELLGHVVELGTITVRTVVPQAFIDLVRQRTKQVEVRLAERLAEPVPAVIRREVPGASERLPSPALGSYGGGQLATDPLDKQGVKAIQKVFQVDLELRATLRVVNVGGRVYIRFDHGRAPLGLQWYRQVRQLFLARFNV
jgi:putative peptide zinc metalloprotease protein